jgi:hypothetical protein
MLWSRHGTSHAPFQKVSGIGQIQLFVPVMLRQRVSFGRVPMNPMNHKGVDYSLALTETPGIWKWQFRIRGEVKTGRTETRINLLAIRRVQLQIDRALKKSERELTA